MSETIFILHASTNDSAKEWIRESTLKHKDKKVDL